MRSGLSFWRSGPEYRSSHLGHFPRPFGEIEAKVSFVVPPYPLAQLLELREARVHELEGQSAAQSAMLARAESEVERIDLQLQAIRARLDSQQRQQLDRAAQGRAVAGDLLQAAAHQTGQRLVVERLTADKAAATLSVERCRQAANQAARALMKARREWTVVQRHQQIFLKRAKRLEENRTEEDAAEAWQAQRASLSRGGGP
jgi:hypothetical protein